MPGHRSAVSLLVRGLLLPALVLVSSFPVRAAVQTWIATDVTATLSLDARHLRDLGLTVVGERETADPAPGSALRMEPELRSFRSSSPGELTFDVDGGRFAGPAHGSATIPFEGGLAFDVRHPRTGASLAPIYLFDFALELDASRDPIGLRLRSSDPALPVPLEVMSVSFRFAWETGDLQLRMGDLVITAALARALGAPELAGNLLGSLELVARARPETGEAMVPDFDPPAASGELPFLDVTLGQLYGISSFGRDGAFPNGRSGLSAATTSCNSGNVRVPWNAPMAETHPFIGIALYRLGANGALEMIGKNWMKHGFAALSNDQCNLGCEGCGGSELCIGCSDTYSAGLNASRFYLGPREEIQPFTGEWVACGSFFDEPVTPDADCARDYDGNEPNGVNHRLEVWDDDLDLPGANYFYEGMYVVAGDADPWNTIGWRECNMVWTGSSWSFSTVGGGLAPELGPVIFTWGDEQVRKEVSDGDGEVVLATRVTDLGGGTWHYEYALYNWLSDRGIGSLSIPVTGATVSNVGFRDIDRNSGNDWAITNDGTTLRFATSGLGGQTESSPLEYQTLFNFRFDSDQPPVPGPVTLGIFHPGPGNSLVFQVQTPGGAATAVEVGVEGANGLALLGAEPNPFAAGTEVRFSSARAAPATLTVVDVTGRRIRTLVDGPVPAGASRVAWDGRDATGNRVGSGVYFFRLESAGEVRTLKGTLVSD